MKPSHIAQLRELVKCYLPRYERGWVHRMVTFVTPLTKYEAAWLRRLTHQYRNQIAAMKRNRKAANSCPNCGRDYFVNETIVDGELRCSCALRKAAG